MSDPPYPHICNSSKSTNCLVFTPLMFLAVGVLLISRLQVVCVAVVHSGALSVVTRREHTFLSQ